LYEGSARGSGYRSADIREGPRADRRHDPQWAEVRNQALERMLKMNAAHAMHAWERRRSVSPIGPHGLAFLYYDIAGGGGRPQHLVVAAATRLFHDDEEQRDVHRLIFRLCRLADERYLPAGRFDPRMVMCNRSDPMSPKAWFLGIGLSTLDAAGSTWGQTQARASGPTQIPGRCMVILSDGSRMLIDREDDRRFGQVRVVSTGDLNVVRDNPNRNWTATTSIVEPAATWDWLLELGKLCDAGQQMLEASADPRLGRPG
jgi:hypothetical protein